MKTCMIFLRISLGLSAHRNNLIITKTEYMNQIILHARKKINIKITHLTNGHTLFFINCILF